MDFQVKFIDDDTSIKETDLVVTEVRHLLQSLLMTEDVNTYQTRSHLRYMMRAYAWRIEMQKLINEVGRCVAENKLKISEMLHRLELVVKFLDEDFKEQVAALGRTSS